MSNIEREAEIERGINEIMLKRRITNTIPYLCYLKGQKEIKRVKAEERMEDAELEMKVIEKMIAKRAKRFKEGER